MGRLSMVTTDRMRWTVAHRRAGDVTFLSLACTGGVIAYALLCGVLVSRSLQVGELAAVLPIVVIAMVPTHDSSIGMLHARAIVAWVLLIAVAPPWQTQAVIAVGSVNPANASSLAKFAVTFASFGFAFMSREPSRKYPWHLRALLAYSVIAALGGLLGAEVFSSLLRAGRFAAVILTVAWLTSRLSRRQLSVWFVRCALGISIVSLGARGAGLSRAYLYGTRLDGYLPPLHPNILGVLAAGALLVVCALWARGELSARVAAVEVPILGATLLLTQSRTSLISFLAGLLILAMWRIRTRGPIIAGLLCLVVIGAVWVQVNTTTKLITSLSTRNGSTTTTGTLGSRASEWKAVLRLNRGPLTEALGQGLASKAVEVDLSSAQYASVDGSLPAAYLSTGIVGVVVLIFAVITMAIAALIKRDDFALTMIVFLVINSITTDVFNDVSIGLLLFGIAMGSFIPNQVASAHGMWADRKLRPATTTLTVY
jgi:O-Antigen ligase